MVFIPSDAIKAPSPNSDRHSQSNSQGERARAKFPLSELRGNPNKKSEGRAKLTVRHPDDTSDEIEAPADEQELEDILEIAHDAAAGRAGVAYLVFGLPGTPTYTLLDLNHLPGHIAAKVMLWRNGRQLSSSIFNAGDPNQLSEQLPVSPAPPPSEVPDWAFALAKTIAYSDPLDENVVYPAPIQEIIDSGKIASEARLEGSEPAEPAEPVPPVPPTEDTPTPAPPSTPNPPTPPVTPPNPPGKGAGAVKSDSTGPF